MLNTKPLSVVDLPKCKICGEKHRLGPCPSHDVLACGEVVTQHAVNVPIAGSNPAEPAKPRAPRGTFDRKTYQRELMRKRRAEGKAEKRKTDRDIPGRPRTYP